MSANNDESDDDDGFELVTCERARSDRHETVVDWVDALLLPKGRSVAAAPPEYVMKRLKEVAKHAPTTRTGVIARVWRARRPIENAVRVCQIAMIVGKPFFALPIVLV